MNALRAGIMATALSLVCAACLGPIGSEHVGYSAELLPKGEPVAAVDGDELLKNKILNNDGIDGELVALRTGFVGGAQVRYWDFGNAPSSLEPIWTFRRRAKDGTAVAIDHYDLIDSIPGDASYSPLRAQYEVFVTSAYAGERITSLRALEDAIELGLVEEPAPPAVYVDRPVAPATVALPWGDEREPSATELVYYRGRVAAQFRIGGDQEHIFALPMPPSPSPSPMRMPMPAMLPPLPTPNAYALRRQSQSNALDEALWKTDLDGDGDQDDSNLVLAQDASAPQYSALWRAVEVTVLDDYAWGGCRAEADLFERGQAGLQARPGVVRWQPSEMLRHLVLVPEPEPEASDE